MAAGERIAELDDYYASHPKQAADTFHAEFTANAGLAAPQSGVRNSFTPKATCCIRWQTCFETPAIVRRRSWTCSR